jgi:glycosyltransferase involved in cell wall biosynthesis
MSGRGLLVHEWIEPRGGAERVLDALADSYPQADIACLWNDAPDRYHDRPVLESVMAKTTLRNRKALALPALPLVWRAATPARGDYDWAIVGSHLFAHHARVPGVTAQQQFTYVHTPARYIWDRELDQRGSHPLVRTVAPVFRAMDRRHGATLEHVAANSAFVRDRIRAAWGVDARVIHPPVGVERLQAVPDRASVLAPADEATLETLPDGFVLGASRFVGYKRLDVVIATGRATGRPVVLAGGGPAESALRALATEAHVPVHFVIDPSDALMAALMQRAAVYVFPPVEDFGIMPVEAMALGTPVVVNGTGGAAESVGDGRWGGVLRDEDPASLRAAVDAASAVDRDARVARAAAFSTAAFQERIAAWTGLSGSTRRRTGP